MTYNLNVGIVGREGQTMHGVFISVHQWENDEHTRMTNVLSRTLYCPTLYDEEAMLPWIIQSLRTVISHVEDLAAEVAESASGKLMLDWKVIKED